MEPVFQTLQAAAPEQLDLKNLPDGLTRFLYLREVDELLRQETEAGEEAFAVEHAARDLESEKPPEDSSPSPVSIWGAVHAVIDDPLRPIQTACGLQIGEHSFPVPVLHTDMPLCNRKACLAMFLLQASLV